EGDVFHFDKGGWAHVRTDGRFDGVYFKAYREDGQFSDGIRTVNVVKMPLWRRIVCCDEKCYLSNDNLYQKTMEKAEHLNSSRFVNLVKSGGGSYVEGSYRFDT
ncbi:hypothetical protein LN378_33110, partial [Enterobacter hormaechei subsp. steigerwaltii]|nr:hypothetical protein [Enterobacter hormaechei subsp. steigerwaltii]